MIERMKKQGGGMRDEGGSMDAGTTNHELHTENHANAASTFHPRERSESVWLLAARPKTLPAAAAPVLLGTAFAVADGGFHWLSASLALLGALLIQIGTNFSNDYADFVQGADTVDRVGPLRVTQAGLVSPGKMRLATAAVFAGAVVAGAYLIWRGGWPVLLIGVASIASGILYTTGKKSIGYLGLGDLFVLIFFGPVAVAGTYYVQALTLPWYVVVAGFGPGLLAVCILLANNIRDEASDRRAGKRTLVVRLGRSAGVRLYVACILGAALVPVVLVLATGDHWAALLSALVAPAALPQIGALRHEPEPARLNPVLGATARLLLLYSLVFAIGWLL